MRSSLQNSFKLLKAISTFCFVFKKMLLHNIQDNVVNLFLRTCLLILQDEHKYLSYENYPVLCRDVAAILMPPEGQNRRKYVCKQTFDCCRHCNAVFYRCLANNKGADDFGVCMRGAYKCTCMCIDRRSFNELPYIPVTTAPPPPPQPGPAEPALPGGSPP